MILENKIKQASQLLKLHNIKSHNLDAQIILSDIMEIPNSFEVQVRPRSGLAIKQGVTVLNSPGTIDSDYRGEVAVILINHSQGVFKISDGDRVAQLVLAKVEKIIWKNAELLTETNRGAGGFGSTGKN